MLEKSDDIRSRYERAKRLYEGVFDRKKIVLNATLVPYWINGTDYFWYRRETCIGVQFRLVNARTTINEPAFDHQTLANALAEASHQRVESDNLPITKVTISLSPLQVSFLAFQKRYIFEAETQKCTTINPETPASEKKSPSEQTKVGWNIPTESLSGEKFTSPDGTKAVIIRDHNFWLQDLEMGEERSLTRDGEPLFAYANSPVSLGLAANAEIQALWSSDSKHLFTVQTDNRQVKTTPVVHHIPEDGSLRPYATEYPCAYPGDEHVEEQRLIAIDVDTGKIQEANYHRLPVGHNGHGLFVSNLAWWAKDNRHAYFVDIERNAQVVRVVEFDTNTGGTRILFEETSATYIKLSCDTVTPATLLPLPNSDELIWYSERSGWAHLYLYDLTTGSLKHPITEGKWIVRDILHFDSKRRELWIQTAGRVASRDPYYLDICRVNVDTREIVTLASGDEEYSVFAPGNIGYYMLRYSDPDICVNARSISPNARYFVSTCSRLNQTPVSLLLDRDGRVLSELETAKISDSYTDCQWPEPVKLLAADGETGIYGAIFKPSDFSPEKSYPVIDYSPYAPDFIGTPKGSFQNNMDGGFLHLQATALAELGFIVITIDGRGSPCRGKSFADSSYGWLPSANRTEDRIAGIKQLAARLTYMDLDRVGIMAVSGSGSALLQYPDFYKVGVYHGIITDARFLAAALCGDRYEGIGPATDNKPAEQLVENLQGKLLLIHGLSGTIVPPASTLRVIDALQHANKDFDMLSLPNVGGLSHCRYAMRRTWDYFITHLLGAKPPTEFNLESEAQG